MALAIKLPDIAVDTGFLDWNTPCSPEQDGFPGFFVCRSRIMKPRTEDSIAKVEMY